MSETNRLAIRHFLPHALIAAVFVLLGTYVLLVGRFPYVLLFPPLLLVLGLHLLAQLALGERLDPKQTLAIFFLPRSTGAARKVQWRGYARLSHFIVVLTLVWAGFWFALHTLSLQFWSAPQQVWFQVAGGAVLATSWLVVRTIGVGVWLIGRFGDSPPDNPGA